MQNYVDIYHSSHAIPPEIMVFFVEVVVVFFSIFDNKYYYSFTVESEAGKLCFWRDFE